MLDRSLRDTEIAGTFGIGVCLVRCGVINVIGRHIDTCWTQ